MTDIEQVREIAARLSVAADTWHRDGHYGQWWIVSGWAWILTDAANRMERHTKRATRCYGNGVVKECHERHRETLAHCVAKAKEAGK